MVGIDAGQQTSPVHLNHGHALMGMSFDQLVDHFVALQPALVDDLIGHHEQETRCCSFPVVVSGVFDDDDDPVDNFSIRRRNIHQMSAFDPVHSFQRFLQTAEIPHRQFGILKFLLQGNMQIIEFVSEDRISAPQHCCNRLVILLLQLATELAQNVASQSLRINFVLDDGDIAFGLTVVPQPHIVIDDRDPLLHQFFEEFDGVFIVLDWLRAGKMAQDGCNEDCVVAGVDQQ